MNLNKNLKNNFLFDKIINLFFLLFFCAKIGFGRYSYLEYILYFFIIVFVFIKIVRRKKIIIENYNIWYGLFTFLCLFSILWSESTIFSLKMIPNVVANFLITILFINHFNDKKGINTLIDIFILSTIITSLKIILFFPFLHNNYSTAGNFINGITGVAVNGVAQMLCFGFIFLFYRTYNIVREKSNSRLKKMIYLCLNILMFLAILLTESRKSIILAIVGIFLLIIFLSENRKKLLQNLVTIFVVFLLIFTIILFINVNLRKEIYQIFVALFGQNSTDESINLRKFFIDTGVDIFKKHPILGIGVNNFAYYVKEYTTYNQNRYSHNNYIEVLSNLGLVGLFIYYYIYAYIILKLLKQLKSIKKNNLLSLSLVTIIILFISEYAVVSYSSCLYQIVIFISYMIVKFDNNNNNNMLEKIKKRVYKFFQNDYFLSIIKKGVNILLGFLTLSLLNRYLGATLKGEYSYLLNYTVIISSIFQFGISAVYSKFKRLKIKNCYEIFISLSILQFILYSILAIGTIFFFQLEKNIVLIIWVSIISILTTQIRYINLVEHYRYNSIAVILMSIVNFISMLIVYLFYQPSVLVAFAVLIIKDVTITLIFTNKINLSKLFKKEYLKYYKEILISGFLPMLANLLIILNYKIDVIMLKSMNINFYQIGLYSVGLSLAEYVWLIPEIFKDVIQKRTATANPISSINFSLRISSTIVFFAYIFMIIFGKPILHVFFGSEYVNAYAVTIILFIGVYSMIYYKIIGSLFIADNKSKAYFLILLMGTVANFIANLILIPQFQIIGAAAASIISYSIIGVFFVLLYVKKYEVNWKELLFIKTSDLNLIRNFLLK